MTVTHVLTQLGRTPGATGAGGAEDATTAGDDATIAGEDATTAGEDATIAGEDATTAGAAEEGGATDVAC